MNSLSNPFFENTETAFAYKTNKALKNALFIFSVVNRPWISKCATALVKGMLGLNLPIGGIIKKTVFYHFCGGEDIEQCEGVVKGMGKYGVKAILDYSVEGEKTESGFEKTTQEILKTIEKASPSANVPFAVFKVSGMVSAQLLEKIQSGEKLEEEDGAAYKTFKDRFERICKKAYDCSVPVMVDAEETWIQKPVDELVLEMMAKYNREQALVFTTYQLYRIDALAELKDALHKARLNGYFFGVKLVRGAYMEKERKRADEMGYKRPIHPDKASTDQAFNDALSFCVENIDRVSVMCASHNEESNFFFTGLMEKKGLSPDDKRCWFAQLYGMGDHISFNLAGKGFLVAKYVPYGPVTSVMPYLFRRAEENTSVQGQSSRELNLIKQEIKRRNL